MRPFSSPIIPFLCTPSKLNFHKNCVHQLFTCLHLPYLNPLQSDFHHIISLKLPLSRPQRCPVTYFNRLLSDLYYSHFQRSSPASTTPSFLKYCLLLTFTTILSWFSSTQRLLPFVLFLSYSFSFASKCLNYFVLIIESSYFLCIFFLEILPIFMNLNVSSY